MGRGGETFHFQSPTPIRWVTRSFFLGEELHQRQEAGASGGGGRWDLGPESQLPPPAMLGPAQEMGPGGPHRETDYPSHRPVVLGGGERGG